MYGIAEVIPAISWNWNYERHVRCVIVYLCKDFNVYDKGMYVQSSNYIFASPVPVLQAIKKSRRAS